MIPGSIASGFNRTRGYKIERSLRFNPADSAYLNKTPGGAGNRRTWTVSFWFKRSVVAAGVGRLAAAALAHGEVHGDAEAFQQTQGVHAGFGHEKIDQAGAEQVDPLRRRRM